MRKPKIRLGNMAAFGTTNSLPFDQERLRAEFQCFFFFFFKGLASCGVLGWG